MCLRLPGWVIVEDLEDHRFFVLVTFCVLIYDTVDLVVFFFFGLLFPVSVWSQPRFVKVKPLEWLDRFIKLVHLIIFAVKVVSHQVQAELLQVYLWNPRLFVSDLERLGPLFSPIESFELCSTVVFQDLEPSFLVQYLETRAIGFFKEISLDKVVDQLLGLSSCDLLCIPTRTSASLLIRVEV